MRVSESVDITFPQRGRRHTVTNYFHRQKPIGVAAEKMFQASALAGRAAKQDQRRSKCLFNLFVNVADFALNILCAAQIFKLSKLLNCHVTNAPLFVKARAEDHAAFAQNKFAQSRERATRRTLTQNFFIGMNCRQSQREAVSNSRLEIQRGTNFVATPALYARVMIDLRISKALGVTNHFNRVFRANVRASLATRTISAIDGNHIFYRT